ncbi:hypothetical protein LO762_29270 [Actinocorallia sp. API 0066]|uniref:hypothetical protein n=1 Tax=Actinocorallia sp. API 0066 TaxID=2896846 RepID=UPI001E2B190C|nr:hypothetical protein [Actinocorallia sp. API 0066]MCD0453241.1 hypothetical protein [Actinocorallia sp. API 0066]
MTAALALPTVPEAAPTVAVTIEAPGVTLIENVDALSDGNRCSCAAGDDNPF